MLYRNVLLIVLVSLFAISSCKETDDDILDIPNCFIPIYNSFVNEQSDCQGASIVAYAFQENEVFALIDGECITDMCITVYTQECDLLCLLAGISGQTECQGVDFFDEAIQVRIIWDGL